MKSLYFRVVCDPFILSLSFALAFSMAGCGQSSSNDPPVPADQATPQERATVDRAVARIQSYAQAGGYEGAFDKLPIVVSANPELGGKFAGSCSFGSDKQPRYIQLSRAAFGGSPLDHPLFISDIFGVLAHEIGHCYFGRSHDASIFAQPGSDIAWYPSGSYAVVVENVPVSIMEATVEIQGLPRSLESYYVQEVMGKERASTLADFGMFSYRPKPAFPAFPQRR